VRQRLPLRRSALTAPVTVVGEAKVSTSELAPARSSRVMVAGPSAPRYATPARPGTRTASRYRPGISAVPVDMAMVLCLGPLL
jgi:hypothetical protein